MQIDRHMLRKAWSVWAVAFGEDTLAAWEHREFITYAGMRRRRWVSKVAVG